MMKKPNETFVLNAIRARQPVETMDLMRAFGASTSMYTHLGNMLRRLLAQGKVTRVCVKDRGRRYLYSVPQTPQERAIDKEMAQRAGQSDDMGGPQT
jgi:hypothetical protein